MSPSYWENKVSGPHVYPHKDIKILRGLEAVQACAEKNRRLKKWFSAKPQFSSSYWEKQCFRSPSLSTYIDFAWFGSSPSMREKNIVFLQSPISSHKTKRGHTIKKMNRKGELQTSRISSNSRIWAILFQGPSNS